MLKCFAVTQIREHMNNHVESKNLKGDNVVKNSIIEVAERYPDKQVKETSQLLYVRGEHNKSWLTVNERKE